MNKVFNINLGGYPFTIDEDAYEHLSTYLKTIHNHFRQSEGYEEITSDIESRLAELFRESLGSRPIVILRDVEDAIAIMGTPEDFGAEPLESPEEEGQAAEGEPATSGEQRSGEKREGRYRTGKRLFRNPEDETIGGVCSGIAAYFGIQDPLWVRLGFILITISGGFGIPLYLILWAILPKAESASDRLSMRGEPINVSNIGKIIEEEMENFSQKMSEFGDGWGFDGEKKKRPKESGQLRSFLRQLISGLGQVIRSIFQLLANIWKPILFIVMVILLIAFAGGWVAAIIGIFFSMPFMDFLYPEAPVIPIMGMVALMAAAGIPILMTAFGIGKRLFRFRMSNYVQAGFWGIWVASLIVMGISISKTAQQFQDGQEVTIENFTDFPDTDTLTIFVEHPNGGGDAFFFHQLLEESNEQLLSHQVNFSIRHTDEPGMYLEQKHYARGLTNEEASQLASMIDYRFWVEGNSLHLNSTFPIAQGTKWRAQNVQLTLFVPEGKVIRFSDDSAYGVLHNIDFDNDRERPWRMTDCSYWVMDANGLVCPEYIRSLSQSKEYSGTGYDRLHLEGKFDVKITRGDQYSLQMNGREEDLSRTEIRQLDDLIDIIAREELDGRVSVTITVPGLEQIDAERIESLEVFGFEEGDMELWLTEIEKARFFGKLNALSLRLSGYSELELRGEAAKMTARLEGRSQLDAGGFQVIDSEIIQRDAARAELWVTGKLQLDVEDAERIVVKKGSPQQSPVTEE